MDEGDCTRLLLHDKWADGSSQGPWVGGKSLVWVCQGLTLSWRWGVMGRLVLHVTIRAIFSCGYRSMYGLYLRASGEGDVVGQAPGVMYSK